jgi:hypothetical protein
MTTKPKLEVEDFIEIPAWNVFGCVLSVKPSMMGSEDSVTVLLQESPDQPEHEMRSYRLEPDEYVVLD